LAALAAGIWLLSAYGQSRPAALGLDAPAGQFSAGRADAVLGRILDGAGFLGNLDALYDRADVEGAAWRALISAWWQQHRDAPQLSGELFPLMSEVEMECSPGPTGPLPRCIGLRRYCSSANT